MLYQRMFLSCAVIMMLTPPLATQTIEERVASLESQVAELWQLHDLNGAPATGVPAELVGNEHMRWGFPGGDCEVLINEYFITCHDNADRVPAWVTYQLSSENLAGEAQRSDDFRPDPRLPAGQRAELPDYVGSGYDRGHMAPAAAFKRSEDAMTATFVLSNMAPQTPSLNRQIWRMLEQDVRELAIVVGSIWVFTGSLFLDDDGVPTAPATFIGENQVAVPTHFYKLILSEAAAGVFEMYGFVMANQAERLSGAPSDYLVSVDSVEVISGLDFFSALPDSLEVLLEQQTAINWPTG